MKKFILLLSVAYCSNLLGQSIRNAQNGVFIRTASYSSEANAGTIDANQASLAGVKHFSASIAAERRFMLNEISVQTLAVAVATSGGNFALGLRFLGGKPYSEMFSSIAYARRMGKIDLGAQFNYFLTRAAGYPSQSAINFEIGALLHLTYQIHVGAHVYNPVSAKKTEVSPLQFPRVFSAGMGYDISENFFAGFRIEKETSQRPTVDVAVKYVFAKSLFARLGMRSVSSTFSFGTGVLFESVHVEIMASLHPQLGITPALMIVYKPNNRE